MAKEYFYDLFSHIKDGSRLADLFNQVMHKLDIVRIVSAPSTFEMVNKDEQCVELFYESCLWELYFHGVVDKLNRWVKVLNEYESEFGSNWKYYASSKRLESIKEYGGDDKDYDTEGNIRTLNLSNEDLECYSILTDLVQDDWRDIVQETKAEHLSGLCASLQTQAKISITDVLKNISGQEIPMYKEDEDGNMFKMTFVDRALSKASDGSRADDLSTMVLFVCHSIQFLIEKVRKLEKFCDNKEQLISVRNDVECLLNLDFRKMDYYKQLYL